MSNIATFITSKKLSNFFMELKAGLYIVATPIGNLDDITLRALFVLKHSDIIYCEDTRATQKLLQKHDISDKKLAIYNDHSNEKERQKIAGLIKEGKVICLVSDAGTPLISDPGFKLSRYLQDQNLHIDALPGACAAIAALTLSGLGSDKFFFAGFMPRTEHGRNKILKSLEDISATIIFYEGPSRILDSLIAIEKTLGNREVVVAREITKIFQTVVRKPVSEIIANFNEIKLKGEFVLLVSSEKAEINLTEEQVMKLIQELKNKGMTAKNIAEELTRRFNKKITKNEIYKMCRIGE